MYQMMPIDFSTPCKPLQLGASYVAFAERELGISLDSGLSELIDQGIQIVGDQRTKSGDFSILGEIAVAEKYRREGMISAARDVCTSLHENVGIGVSTALALDIDLALKNQWLETYVSTGAVYDAAANCLASTGKISRAVIMGAYTSFFEQFGLDTLMSQEALETIDLLTSNAIRRCKDTGDLTSLRSLPPTR